MEFLLQYEFILIIGLVFIILEIFSGVGYFVSLGVSTIILGIIQAIFNIANINIVLIIYIPLMFIGLFITKTLIDKKNKETKDINDY